MTGVLAALIGAGGKLVYLENVNGVYGSVSAGSAGLRVDSDGNVYSTNLAGTYLSRFQWLRSGSAADYSVRVTATGGSPGTFSSGPSGWVSCGSDQTWTRNTPVAGLSDVEFTIELALTSDTSNVLASASGTLTAERII